MPMTFSDLAKTKEDAYFRARDAEILARMHGGGEETSGADLSHATAPKIEGPLAEQGNSDRTTDTTDIPAA